MEKRFRNKIIIIIIIKVDQDLQHSVLSALATWVLGHSHLPPAGQVAAPVTHSSVEEAVHDEVILATAKANGLRD